MGADEKAIVEQDSLKPRVMIIGGIIGAAVGVGAAYLLLQNRDENGELDISAGQGVKLGVVVLGLLRSVATL